MSAMKENTSVRFGGRVLLICQLLSVGLVFYLTYTHKAAVSYQHYGERVTSIDYPPEKKESKLLSSKWIKLFPHLQHLVATMESKSGDILYESTTSAKYTDASVQPSDLTVGGKLSALIQARDHRNFPKTYGGDFFIVTLRRPGHANDGISCEVNDRMDGLYDITCLTPWSGDAKLSVILLHPSESVYHMIKTYSSSTEYGVIFNTSLLGSGKRKEFTRCSIGFPELRQEQLCDYSNPTHGEQWTCLRPASGECSKIIAQEYVKKDLKALAFFDNMYFQKGVNHEVEIKGSGVTVQVLEAVLKKSISSSEKSSYSAQNNKIAANPETPSGWFFDGKWTSMSVQSKGYSDDLMRTCLQNKEIFLIGDSTSRQWFTRFLQIFKLQEWGPDHSKAWSMWRGASSKLLNLTLHYRAHGPPLHNLGPPESRPYVTDTLDNITSGGEETIVVVNVGLHFEMFDADVFGDRIARIRESLQVLLSRLPTIHVFVRGMHTHEYVSLCPSAWLSYRYDVMLRNEFANMEGVTFLDMWGLSVLLNSRLLHPDWRVLQKQLGLFLSHLC